MLSISNMSVEDVDLLKNMYFIQEIPFLQNKASCEKEIKFLIELRQRLYRLLTHVCKVPPQEREKYDSEACDLAQFIEDYLSTDDYKAITRKMLVIEHFKSEIEQIGRYVTEKYMYDDAFDIKDYSASLLLFLEKTASTALSERAKSDEEKLTKDVFGYLQSKLPKNFMDYIDQKNLTSFDFYLLIGELQKNREKAYEMLETIQKSSCDGCGRDDCMLPTKCGTIERKDAAANACDKYDRLLNVLVQKIKGENVPSYLIEAALAKQNNKQIKSIAQGLLYDEYVDGAKKSMLFYSPAERAVVIPSKLKEIASQEVGEEIDIDNITPKQIATLGVLNLFNFNYANGDDIVNRFNASEERIEGNVSQLSESELIQYKKLLKKFSEMEKSK